MTYPYISWLLLYMTYVFNFVDFSGARPWLEYLLITVDINEHLFLCYCYIQQQMKPTWQGLSLVNSWSTTRHHGCQVLERFNLILYSPQHRLKMMKILQRRMSNSALPAKQALGYCDFCNRSSVLRMFPYTLSADSCTSGYGYLLHTCLVSVFWKPVVHRTYISVSAIMVIVSKSCFKDWKHDELLPSCAMIGCLVWLCLFIPYTDYDCVCVPVPLFDWAYLHTEWLFVLTTLCVIECLLMKHPLWLGVCSNYIVYDWTNVHI